MGNSVQMPGWYAPQTHEGKTMAESLLDMTGSADVFEMYRTKLEVVFVFNRGYFFQIAKKGGGTLFKEYDGEWVCAFLHGKKVIHESGEVYSQNPVDHLGAARLYAGILSNADYRLTPHKYHGALEVFWRGTRNFEVIIPS